MPETPPTGAVRFSPVRREERLSDRIVEMLTASILAGELAVGERLPTERILCVRLEVSRPVVREAIRSLIATGLLIEHPRRGYVVSDPQASKVRDSLSLFVRGRHLDYREVAEVRDVLEVETATHAAARAQDAQVTAIAAAAARLQPGLTAADAAEADVDFHRAIALAAGNAFFVVLVDSMREVLLDVQVPTLADPAIVATAREAHDRIAVAIAARDPDAAGDAMRQHLRLAREQMRDLVRASGGVVAVQSLRTHPPTPAEEHER